MDLFRPLERLAVHVELKPVLVVMADQDHAELALDPLPHLLPFRQNDVLSALHVLRPPEETSQVLKGNPSLLGHLAVRPELEGADRRHVENVGLRPELRVQRQSHLPLVDKLVNRALRVVLPADEPDPPRALPEAGRRHALLDPGVAKEALLGLADEEVEIRLLVRAGPDAVAIPLHRSWSTRTTPSSCLL